MKHHTGYKMDMDISGYKNITWCTNCGRLSSKFH